uniref:rhotekin-like n=1 Tax=Myxine glutinosa TaxID=7769 RepID=UPI00358E5439
MESTKRRLDAGDPSGEDADRTTEWNAGRVPLRRNVGSRATVARGSALEMEIKRRRIRESALILSQEDKDAWEELEREQNVRESLSRLLKACTQRQQALEAAKALRTCDARIMGRLSRMQRSREEKVHNRRHTAPGSVSVAGYEMPPVCKAKLSISDIRIPLMWKDTDHFQNKGEFHRFAIFCLLTLGADAVDTELMIVDRSVTDICFDSAALFSEVPSNFSMLLEVYSCRMDGDLTMASTPRRLAARIGSSVGRSRGRAVHQLSQSPQNSSTLLPAARYHLLAHTTFRLHDVNGRFKTHDLCLSGNENSPFWLPLYGNVCCRLAAVPTCMVENGKASSMWVKDEALAEGSWWYCVLKGAQLLCHQSLEASNDNRPRHVISLKGGRLSRCDGDIKLDYGDDATCCILLRASSREESDQWLFALQQQLHHMHAWKQCCENTMKIEESKRAHVSLRPKGPRHKHPDTTRPVSISQVPGVQTVCGPPSHTSFGQNRYRLDNVSPFKERPITLPAQEASPEQQPPGSGHSVLRVRSWSRSLHFGSHEGEQGRGKGFGAGNRDVPEKVIRKVKMGLEASKRVFHEVHVQEMMRGEEGNLDVTPPVSRRQSLQAEKFCLSPKH